MVVAYLSPFSYFLCCVNDQNIQMDNKILVLREQGIFTTENESDIQVQKVDVMLLEKRCVTLTISMVSIGTRKGITGPQIAVPFT